MSRDNEGKVYDLAEKRRQQEAEAAAQKAAEAQQPAKDEPRVVDGLEVDEQGQVVLTDEERALLGAVQPKPLDGQIGDLATRLYATEMELTQTRQLLQHRSVALVKALRRAKELEAELAKLMAAPAPKGA